MTNKKLFGLIAAALALVLSACANVSGSPRGNFAFNGENLVMYQGSSFCFNTDTKIKTPAGGEINVAKGSEIVASQVLTLNVKNGDISANAFSVRDCSTVVASPTNSPLQTPAPTAVLTQTAALTQTGNVSVTVNLTQTAQLAATAVPTVAPTAQPTAVPASSFVGLDYQDDGNECINMPADVAKTWTNCWFQMLQAKVTSPAIAVPAIQRLCGAVKCTTWEASEVAVPNKLYVGVWCPAGGNRDSIADAANPLGGQLGKEWMNNLFLIEAGTGGPDRIVRSNDPKQACWVWVRK